MSKEYIDVFYSPNDKHTPYCAFIWRNNEVIGTISHRHLETTAEWCKLQKMPVVSASADLRTMLRSYGVEVRTPEEVLRRRVQPNVVQIRLTGTSESVDIVWQALMDLNIAGLDITIKPPRPARQSDGSGVLAFGAITVEVEQATTERLPPGQAASDANGE